MNRRIVTAIATVALMLGLLAAPAAAQPVITGGLVNVTVTDVLTGDILTDNEVNLAVALNLAANICDVNVNVLARQLRRGGAECETATQRVTIQQR